MFDMIWAFIKGMRNTVIPIVTGVVGFLVGLVIFGWYLWPVAYVDAGPQDLRQEDHQQFYLRSLATGYALEGNQEFVIAALSQWPEAPSAICEAKGSSEAGGSQTDALRLENMATIFDPGGCASITAQAPAPQPGRNWLMTCLYGILFVGLLGVLFFLWQRRNADSEIGADIFASNRPTEVPTAPPAMSAVSGDETAAADVTPIASYRTTFVRGYDAYDDSFSIENTNGDFLGECGVGISESIGTDSPRNVTALEVWLFDKNDIRTITKVAMSDFAFFDEAIKAKLAPKGEPILARLDEVIVLETAALIINARITELEYGDNPSLQPKSFFERFGVEISAWAKDGAPAGGAAMNFDDFDV